MYITANVTVAKECLNMQFQSGIIKYSFFRRSLCYEHLASRLKTRIEDFSFTSCCLSFVGDAFVGFSFFPLVSFFFREFTLVLVTLTRLFSRTITFPISITIASSISVTVSVTLSSIVTISIARFIITVLSSFTFCFTILLLGPGVLASLFF